MPPDTPSPHSIHAQRLCAPTCQRLCLVGRISSLFSCRDVWNNLRATVQLKAHGTQTTRNRDTRRHPEGKNDPQRDVAGAPEEWKMVTFICRGQEGIRKKSEIKMDSGSREGVLRAAPLSSWPPHHRPCVNETGNRRARLETYVLQSGHTELLLVELIYQFSAVAAGIFITSLMIKHGCCSLPHFALQHFIHTAPYGSFGLFRNVKYAWRRGVDGNIMFVCPKIEKVYSNS